MNNILSRLKEIASAVLYAAEAIDLEETLDRIAQLSRELARTKYAALGIPDGKGGLRFFKTAGMTRDEVNMLEHLPFGHGLIGAIMKERKPIRLERMDTDERSVGFCRHHPIMTSLLGVPVQLGEQLFGMLYLCDKEDGSPFNEDDEILIETLAGYAALAIVGADLSDQQSRIKLLEERERIGMELHDGIIQTLYALGMHVDLIRTSEKIQGKDLLPVIEGLNEVIEDIRRFIMKLHQPETRPITIRECFMNLITRLHPPQSLQLELQAADELPPFTPAIFEGICLIVNEALSNAMRHSEAHLITVHAKTQVGVFVVEIFDDGRGFKENEATNQSGLGLHNMKQRARFYGGDVTILSTPGSGTQLTIRIPIRV